MNAVLLEVAQIALPQLIERCRAVLQAYCLVEQAAIAQELQELAIEAAQLGARGVTSMHQQQQLGQQQQQQQVGQLLPPQQQQEEGPHVQQQQEQGAAARLSLAECAVGAAIQQQEGQQGGTDCASPVQLQQKCLVEEVLCALHVLLDLQLDAAVFDHLVEREPSLAACLGSVQHAQQLQEHLQHQQQQHQQQQQPPAHSSSPEQQQVQQLGQKQGAQQTADDAQRRSSSSTQGTASAAAAGAGDGEGSLDDGNGRKHQGHLLLLYKELAACAGCRDRRVGVLVRAALQAVGRQLAL
jgi:hypothetical protein